MRIFAHSPKQAQTYFFLSVKGRPGFRETDKCVFLRTLDFDEKEKKEKKKKRKKEIHHVAKPHNVSTYFSLSFPILAETAAALNAEFHRVPYPKKKKKKSFSEFLKLISLFHFSLSFQ